jgi:hypothetical protein
VVSLPNVVGSDPIAARFRWGSAGLNYYGTATIGEVEDYFLTIVGQPAVTSTLPGDYDNSGTVGDNDYTVWKLAYHTQNLAADGNGDGVVDALDFAVWRNNYGNSAPASAGGGGGLSLLAAVVSDSMQSDDQATSEGAASLQFEFVPFETTASPLHSTPSMLRELGLVGVTTDAELELLDRILANSGRDESELSDDEAPQFVELESSGQSDDDLLAIAFDEVTDWRYSL